MAAGATYDEAAQASAGQLITWVLIPLLSVSAVFAYERAKGTQKRAFATPTSKAHILIGTIGGEFVIALVQMTLMVAFGVFALNLPWGRQPLALAAMLIAFGVCGAALGTMLGAFIKTEGQAQGLSIMLGMVMALLGSCWCPAGDVPGERAKGSANYAHILGHARPERYPCARGWAGWGAFARWGVDGFCGGVSIYWRVAVSGRVRHICMDKWISRMKG